MIVVSERDREDGLAEHVGATLRGGSVHGEGLAEDVDADREFLRDFLERTDVFDEPLEAIESDGGSAEAIDDALGEEHRGDNRVPFHALQHGEKQLYNKDASTMDVTLNNRDNRVHFHALQHGVKEL